MCCWHLALMLLFGNGVNAGIVWQVDEPGAAAQSRPCRCSAGDRVLPATFLINHFELFGLHQVANNLTGAKCLRRVPDAVYYKFRAASDLSRLYHRVCRSHDERRHLLFRGEPQPTILSASCWKSVIGRSLR